MIDAETYTALTGAAAPEGFEALEAVVVSRLANALGRDLDAAERTEWVTTYDGLAFPQATPITDVDEETGGQLDDRTVEVWGAPAVGQGRAQVTYTGGYLPHGDDGDGVPCPAPLAESIAWGVHTLAGPSGAGLPTGLVSMSVGEWTVTRGDRAVGADGEALPRWAHGIGNLGGRCAQLAARYRRIPLGV